MAFEPKMTQIVPLAFVHSLAKFAAGQRAEPVAVAEFAVAAVDLAQFAGGRGGRGVLNSYKG